MDYRDDVFLSVAEKLSFSKAAEDLFISQPAVTKHIKELEGKLNTTLFERKGNRVYLTESGKITYRHLKEIKQQYRELEFELGKLNDTFKGTLRIGASSTIAQYLIPAVISAFHKRYPKIELFVYNGNSQEMESKLLSNEIDLALVENESSQSDIRYIDFYDDEIVAITGINSVYSKRKAITMFDLQQIPIVLREKGSGTLEVIQKSLIQHNITLENLNVFIHLGSTEAIKNLLYSFEGIAFVSKISIEKELQLKTIVILSILNLRLNRKFRIALRHGHEAIGSKLFVDFLSIYNF